MIEDGVAEAAAMTQEALPLKFLLATRLFELGRLWSGKATCSSNGRTAWSR